MKQKVNECVICGEFDESRLEMVEHLNDDHSLQERHNALLERTQRPEVDSPQ